MTHEDEIRAREARRAHIESLLSNYPDLTEQELALMKTWFDKQASALDVAQVASRSDLQQQYQAFKAAHVDPLRGADWLRAVLFAAVVIACIAGITWRAF